MIKSGCVAQNIALFEITCYWNKYCKGLNCLKVYYWKKPLAAPSAERYKTVIQVATVAGKTYKLTRHAYLVKCGSAAIMNL